MRQGEKHIVIVCRVLDFRLKGHVFETYWRYCVVSLSKALSTPLSTGFNPGKRDNVPT